MYVNHGFITGEEMCTLLSSVIPTVIHTEQSCQRCVHPSHLKAHRRPLRH